MGEQQEQNSVGKKVIGIAATGLKNYFGLIKYYSEYYESTNSISPTDNTYFLKEFTLNGEKITVRKIAGLNLTRQSNEILKESLRQMLSTDVYKNKYTGQDITPEQIDLIIDEIVKLKPDNDVALNISSILSLATDNAKELMLAKINAGIDFASMHIYLAILGVDTETVAKFMTNPNAFNIKKKLTRDFFSTNFDASIAKKLSRIKPKESDIDSEYFSEFIKVFNYATELISLGSLFKVNQGSKATQEDLYKLTTQFQSTIITQEKNYFRGLQPTSVEGGAKNDYTGASNYDKADFIIKEKPYLTDHYDDVINILNNADYYKISNKGKIDVHRYFNDADYRKTITDYYNLIKYTFNIFDVLNNLPHFYQMFKAFVDGEQFLIKKVPKYKFVKKSAERIFEKGYLEKELTEYNINKEVKLGGDAESSIMLSDSMISKVNDYYDYNIIKDFTKIEGFTIHLPTLMNYLGINKINLLEYDKVNISEKTFNIDNLPFDDIDLRTEYGTAQFRYLMENYIINNEKGKYPSNGFLNNYVKNIHKNFNLKNKIQYYLDKSNFAELEELEIGMSLLIANQPVKNDFSADNKNKDYTVPGKINNDGSLERFKLIDLLTMYDIIVNEGRFGGNRATIFFSKDISNEESLSRKFVEYQKLVEENDMYSDDLERTLISDADKRKIFYFKVFAEVDLNNKELQKSVDLGPNILKLNRYFNIVDSMENVEFVVEATNSAKELLGLLKNKNINIITNCK